MLYGNIWTALFELIDNSVNGFSYWGPWGLVIVFIIMLFKLLAAAYPERFKVKPRYKLPKYESPKVEWRDSKSWQDFKQWRKQYNDNPFATMESAINKRVGSRSRSRNRTENRNRKGKSILVKDVKPAFEKRVFDISGTSYAFTLVFTCDRLNADDFRQLANDNINCLFPVLLITSKDPDEDSKFYTDLLNEVVKTVPHPPKSHTYFLLLPPTETTPERIEAIYDNIQIELAIPQL